MCHFKEVEESGISMSELLESRIKGIMYFNEPMRNHTSFRIGGPADVFIVPDDVNDVIETVSFAKSKCVPIYIVGNGTKLLVGDEGIKGMVIKIANTLDWLDISNEQIVAGAGAQLTKIAEIAEKTSLSGLEFAAGIPGTLGGAITMNASTYIGSISDTVKEVTAINMKTGESLNLSKKECGFTYRGSIFQKGSMLILSAELRLAQGNKKEIKKTIKELIAKRIKTEPLDKPNAGSIFKNPKGASAGKLIESVGLKGKRIGNAQISEKHANFIVNLGNARADDVHALVKLAQKEVKSKYGIDLIPELRIIGEFKSPNHF